MRRLFLTLALTAGTLHTAGATPPDTWGVVANGAWGACSDDTCTQIVGTLGGGTSVADGSGGINVPSAAFSITNANGTATSSAEYRTALAAPWLTATAASAPTALVQATATGIQGYEFTGPAGDITVSISLTGNVTNPDSDGLTGLTAAVTLVPADVVTSFEAAYLAPAYAALGVLEVVFPGAVGAGFGAVASGTVAQSDTLSLSLAPGDRFYLVAYLSAGASGEGASALSSTTLTTAFVTAGPGDPDPVATLVPASTPAPPDRSATVPLPGLALVVLAVLVVAPCVRQRHRA